MTVPRYFDYNATTPVDPEVADAIEPYLREHFGNPSSRHVYGQRAHDAVSGVLGAMGITAERARGAVRLSLGMPTTREEVERVASALINAWVKQRGHQ